MRIDQIELTGSLSISSSLAASPLRVNKTYLFVSNTGNVGIGTSNPTSKLVVTGSASIRGGIKATTASGSFTFNESIFSLDTTSVLKIPVGTTAQRPVSNFDGYIRFNTSTGNPEWYDSYSNIWVNFGSRGFVSVDFLIIGGGGSGPNATRGGGGGAGGYRLLSSQVIEKGVIYLVTVGAGGVNNSAGDGSPSTYGQITSAGGGGSARSGGSGGGGNGPSGGGAAGNVPSTSPSQGNAGASGLANSGGGGGGAGSAGSGINGGIGVASSITGTSVTRAVGGAGGVATASPPGSPGTANTGNGGEGGGFNGSVPGSAGNGGSGVVIIRWLTSRATISLTGGAQTNAVTYTDGLYTAVEIRTSGLVAFL
jgi:hypothetical protein